MLYININVDDILGVWQIQVENSHRQHLELEVSDKKKCVKELNLDGTKKQTKNDMRVFLL